MRRCPSLVQAQPAFGGVSCVASQQPCCPWQTTAHLSSGLAWADLQPGVQPLGPTCPADGGCNSPASSGTRLRLAAAAYADMLLKHGQGHRRAPAQVSGFLMQGSGSGENCSHPPPGILEQSQQHVPHKLRPSHEPHKLRPMSAEWAPHPLWYIHPHTPLPSHWPANKPGSAAEPAAPGAPPALTGCTVRGQDGSVRWSAGPLYSMHTLRLVTHFYIRERQQEVDPDAAITHEDWQLPPSRPRLCPVLPRRLHAAGRGRELGTGQLHAAGSARELCTGQLHAAGRGRELGTGQGC